KLIVAGPDRETARRRLAAALDGLVIGGVGTNAAFHRWLVDLPAVVEGRVTTRVLDETPLPPAPEEAAAAAFAAARWVQARDAQAGQGPWRGLPGFRVTPQPPTRTVYLAGRDTHNVVVGDHIPRPAGSSARSTPLEERRRDQSG